MLLRRYVRQNSVGRGRAHELVTPKPWSMMVLTVTLTQFAALNIAW
jgi:hypothetical protein